MPLNSYVRNQEGQAIAGTTVSLNGSQTGTTTTDSNGAYSFQDLGWGGNYTVTPSKAGYSFAPQNRSYNNLTGNQSGADFTGTPDEQILFSKTINYAYNAVGALASVGTNLIGSDPNATTNVLNTTTFRANGALKSLNYGNGRRLTMGYNAERQQPISMRVDRISDASDRAVEYQYQYYNAENQNNNRLRHVTDNLDPNYSADYSYDAYNRLEIVQATAYTRVYTYDAWGNRRGDNYTGQTYNYALNATGAPATNQLVSVTQGGVTQASYSYDAAGNTTAGEGQTFAYDGANRLKAAGGGTSSYGYDGEGMRVRATDNGAAVYYVHSTVLQQNALEITATGAQRVYVYANGKQVALQAPDGQFYWLYTNHLGSARAMTDANGTLVYRGQFDPYGAALTEWSATSNPNLNSKKFTGYERDTATGLDYAQARMYNSLRGRFMQPDPLGLGASESGRPQSLNRYSYVNNDPTNFTDPEGLTRCGELNVVSGFFRGQTVSQVMRGTGDYALMAQLVYHEAGTIFNSDLANIAAYQQELIAIGTAILNQWDVDNERIQVYNVQKQRVECPLGGCLHRSLKDVIINIGKDNNGAIFNPDGTMRTLSRQRLDSVLNTDWQAPPLVPDNGVPVNIGCEGMLASIARTSDLLNGLAPRYKPNNYVLLYWNMAAENSTSTFPGSEGYIGVRSQRANGHTFWGLLSFGPRPTPGQKKPKN